MKIVFSLISIVLMALILSCAASQEVTNFWRSPEASRDHPYKSVLILVMTGERAARNTIETDLALAASKHGIKAVRSADHFPVTFTAESTPSNDEIIAKVRELGCEAIFTLSVLDVKSEQRYVEGETTYGDTFVPRFDYHGGFVRYYRVTFPVVTEPGYYPADKTYFIESNLYDAKTEEIQWSMQSTAYNPSSLNSFSAEYTELPMKRLEQENKTGGSKQGVTRPFAFSEQRATRYN